MNIQYQLVPEGHPNRPGTKLEAFKAIAFHYTANDAPAATDTMNAKYFARPYIQIGKDFFEKDGKTPFGYGSAQVVADSDSVTIAIPTNEAAWAVGDRRVLPWTEQWRGQQKMSRNVFNCRPNYQSISIEICNNDVVKNSNTDWLSAINNAVEWTIAFLLDSQLTIDVKGTLDPQNATPPSPRSIILCRHFDITGKICPKPFIDNVDEWNRVVHRIIKAVNV